VLVCWCVGLCVCGALVEFISYQWKEIKQNWYRDTSLVLIGTDCIGSCKSNYHAITTTTAPTCRFYLLINSL
jgi:hypothetical protein